MPGFWTPRLTDLPSQRRRKAGDGSEFEDVTSVKIFVDAETPSAMLPDRHCFAS